MRAVRGFARYLHGIEPATEIPPLELLHARRERPTPHIYSEAEIAALTAAARTLRPALRAATLETVIGLLACTGLRVGEAFALDRADIDTGNRLLGIRGSKFGKSREVLIHDSTLAALNACLERRDGLRPGGDRVCVFVSSWGARLNHNAMQRAFDQIRRAAGVTGASPGRWPRAHDLRHTFAIYTLLRWYRNGDDVAAKLPLLSTYLGHAGVDTSVIALWLGHESTDATQIYLHADMAIKERALARTTPTGVKPGRYHPTDALLAFLEQL